jgi:hypothetical protein
MNGDRSATATFTLVERELTLSKAGDGQGTVTSSPAGISCAELCTSDSADYGHGTDVTLTASESDPLSTFVGWSGCDTENGDECIVDMTSDRTVTATFSLIVVPPGPTGPTGP